MSIDLYAPDASRIIHGANVDFKQRSISKTIHIVQYDKSLPILSVKLYSENKEWVLPDSITSVKIRWGKKDHTYVYTDALGCDETRTVVYFEILEQMTIFHGECNPVVEVSIGDTVACSSPIPIFIDRNPIQRDDIESQVTPSILEQIMAFINDNCVTKATDQTITGAKVFNGNVTFNSGLAYTGTGSIVMNPSYLGINNSEIQTSNTSVEIGTGSGKTYVNRLPSTFHSTVIFNSITNFNAGTNIKSNLYFVGSDNKTKMYFNRDGNLYFDDGTAFSINIDDPHKIRYTKSDGQLELRGGDLKLSSDKNIVWGNYCKIKAHSSYGASRISFEIEGKETLSIIENIIYFKAYPRLFNTSMGTTADSLTTKQYVDDIFTRISGYDASKTQTLKNINGTLTWVDD